MFCDMAKKWKKNPGGASFFERNHNNNYIYLVNLYTYPFRDELLRCMLCNEIYQAEGVSKINHFIIISQRWKSNMYLNSKNWRTFVNIIIMIMIIMIMIQNIKYKIGTKRFYQKCYFYDKKHLLRFNFLAQRVNTDDHFVFRNNFQEQ